MNITLIVREYWLVVLNEGRDLAGEEKGQLKGRKTRFTAGLSSRGGESFSCQQRLNNLFVLQSWLPPARKPQNFRHET